VDPHQLAQIQTQLHALETHVEGHMRYLLMEAQRCPFGGNHDWDKVLTQYGQEHDPPLKRLEDAQRAGQSRGASMNEVRRAAEGLKKQASDELDRVVSPLPIGAAGMIGTEAGQLGPRISHLRARLSRVVDEVCAQHASNVCPPQSAVAASVNSVFANATSTAKLTPWANVKFDATKVYECRACGAPQQAELDFLCRYCRSPMNG
jgi:hypothetical protein